MQTGVEGLKQAMLFLEDASDVAELLDADLDDMDEARQVPCRGRSPASPLPCLTLVTVASSLP